MPRFTLFAAIALALEFGAADAGAQLLRNTSSEEQVVVDAAQVLDELMTIPLRSIPSSLLATSEGVIICPKVLKVGFVLGGRGGRGVLLMKTGERDWSNPILLRLHGGSVGWQAGVQSSDVMLVLRTRRTVNALLEGQRFTLGADASIAAGPLGRETAASTDLKLQSEILSYSRSRGLFAGISFNGSALNIDAAANGAYYQRAGVTPADIIAGKNLAPPQSAQVLREAVARHASAEMPAEVAGKPNETDSKGR